MPGHLRPSWSSALSVSSSSCQLVSIRRPWPPLDGAVTRLPILLAEPNSCPPSRNRSTSSSHSQPSSMRESGARNKSTAGLSSGSSSPIGDGLVVELVDAQNLDSMNATRLSSLVVAGQIWHGPVGNLPPRFAPSRSAMARSHRQEARTMLVWRRLNETR